MLDYFRLSRNVDLPHSNIQYYFEIIDVFNKSNKCCVSGHKLVIGSSVSASPVFDDYLQFFPSFGFVWTFGPVIAGTSP